MPNKHFVTSIIKEECELKKHKQFCYIYIYVYIYLKLNNSGTGALLSSLLYKQWRGGHYHKDSMYIHLTV